MITTDTWDIYYWREKYVRIWSHHNIGHLWNIHWATCHSCSSMYPM